MTVKRVIIFFMGSSLWHIYYIIFLPQKSIDRL